MNTRTFGKLSVLDTDGPTQISMGLFVALLVRGAEGEVEVDPLELGGPTPLAGGLLDHHGLGGCGGSGKRHCDSGGRNGLGLLGGGCLLWKIMKERR